MNKDMKSIEILDALEQDVEYIESCIEAYNNSLVPFVPTEYLSACIKENGEVVGEIMAEIHFGNVLFIDILWVNEKCRGKGYATALMNHIEKLGIEKGCKLSHVSTYEFQALGLYQKLGYTLFGYMDDVPLGYKDYYLQKKLKPCNVVETEINIHEPTEEELECFCRGLIEYNRSKLLFDNIPESSSFNKCIKASGKIVGGILAYTFWNMAVVEALWVSDEFRNKGYATALLTALERYAKENGNTIIYLETFNPQMRNLCEKLGYVVYGVMEDYPEGHSRYYVCKKIERSVSNSRFR